MKQYDFENEIERRAFEKNGPAFRMACNNEKVRVPTPQAMGGLLTLRKANLFLKKVLHNVPNSETLSIIVKATEHDIYYIDKIIEGKFIYLIHIFDSS